MNRLRRLGASFARESRGGIIPMAAAGVPVVALLAIAATELASLSSEKALMQDVADAVVLDAANQLSFSSPESALARAEANAREQLASMEPRTTLTVKAELVEEGKGVRLYVQGNRLSFFGNMLPPGGFKTAVNSAGVVMNMAPLCLTVLDASKTLKVEGRSRVDAGECLVHSNGDIETSGDGTLRALAIQAGGSAKGSGMTPSAVTGARVFNDPFASLRLIPPARCDDTDLKFDKVGRADLPAGRHCGHLDIEETTVTLGAGVHYFDDEVQLKKGTELIGDNVLIVFEKNAKFTFDDPSVRLELKGRRNDSAGLDGFVFLTTRDRTAEVKLYAPAIRRLEGVVHVPTSRLKIEKAASLPETVTSPVLSLVMAEASKWTVIVAKELEVRDGATMVVNTNYVASDVPVPVGVGDKVGRNIRLAR